MDGIWDANIKPLLDEEMPKIFKMISEKSSIFQKMMVENTRFGRFPKILNEPIILSDELIAPRTDDFNSQMMSYTNSILNKLKNLTSNLTPGGVDSEENKKLIIETIITYFDKNDYSNTYEFKVYLNELLSILTTPMGMFEIYQHTKVYELKVVKYLEDIAINGNSKTQFEERIMCFIFLIVYYCQDGDNSGWVYLLKKLIERGEKSTFIWRIILLEMYFILAFEYEVKDQGMENDIFNELRGNNFYEILEKLSKMFDDKLLIALCKSMPEDM